MPNPNPQVLITGAGPTGLVLAIWLTAQNIPVRIIDKSPLTSKTSRAMVVQARVLELYQQLGLNDAILKAGHLAPATNFWYSGVHKARLPLKEIGTGKTPYPFIFILPQDRHERVLEERLTEMGVEVERGVELDSFVEEGEKVKVTLKKDGKEEVCEVDYVAGCDGARSIVRHISGIEFEGGTYPHAFYVADVEGSGNGFTHEVNINLSATEFMLVFGIDDMRHARLVGLVSGEHMEKLDSLTFDDVSHVAMNEMKINVEKVNWFSTYHVHHRVAEHFRKGRVFLVGDAAHVHSPVGGQGMNTGISDAINLAWKLAAVLKSHADDSLLDSYEAERRAFALTLVATTDQGFSAVTSEGWIANTFRGWIMPYVAPLAMRFPFFTNRMFNTISQTMLNYRDGPLAEGSAGSVHAGDRLPWALVNEVDNYSSLSIKWQVHVYGAATDDMVDWCKKKDIPLQVFEWDTEYDKPGLTRDAAYLLRPDTYIGAVDPAGSAECFEKYISSHGLPSLA